jgi:hypothetical protein
MVKIFSIQLILRKDSSSPKERLNKVNSEQTDAKRPKKFRHWDHKFEWTSNLK